MMAAMFWFDSVNFNSTSIMTALSVTATVNGAIWT
jgi:hypothetical protein